LLRTYTFATHLRARAGAATIAMIATGPHVRTAALRRGRTTKLKRATRTAATIGLRTAHHRALRPPGTGATTALAHHRRTGTLRARASEVLQPTTKASALTTKHRTLRTAALRAPAKLLRAALRTTHRRSEVLRATSTATHQGTTRTAITVITAFRNLGILRPARTAITTTTTGAGLG